MFWKKHGGHILGGAKKLVAKIKLTSHLLQQENLTNEARSASMRSTDKCVNMRYLSPPIRQDCCTQHAKAIHTIITRIFQKARNQRTKIIFF